MSETLFCIRYIFFLFRVINILSKRVESVMFTQKIMYFCRFKPALVKPGDDPIDPIDPIHLTKIPKGFSYQSSGPAGTLNT